MTSETECFVYIVLPGETDFVTAGRFQLDDGSPGPIGRFVYGRRYRERPDAVELDPVELRLSSQVYETATMDGVFGAIRDSMPDYWGRRVIERHAGLTQLGELDYLLKGADDRAGALGFGLNVEPPAPERRFNRALDLATLQAAADAILADDPVKAGAANLGSAGRQVEELLQVGTSMGGARPKTVIEDDGSLWVAKFGRLDDRWNVPRVEHGMLALAAACNLTVADSRIETVAGRDVLMVRRFDRDQADGGYRRHRMVSALTLLRASDNQADRQRWSYLLFADEIRRVSAESPADLRELFGRLCFNAATSNLDDHPRNHAVLSKGRGWRLSPAFDLTPSPAMSKERRDLAMVCGRYGRYANKANLMSDHGRFLLGETEAESIFDRIAGRVRDQWHPTMRRAGVSEADCDAIAGAFLYEGLFQGATA